MEDHVVIITGAGGGIGGVMARALLDAGRRVVAVDIDAGHAGLTGLERHADTHESGTRLLTMTANVRALEECEGVLAATLGRFGAVHGLINNAGIPPYHRPDGTRPRFFDVPVDYWIAGVDTNLNGPYRMTRTVGPALVEQGWGRIVNVTTSLTTMTALGATPYGATKAGLEAASSIWSKELAETGVTVNVLVPGGATDTPFVPHAAVPDRSTLIAADVMAAPAVWLISHASDGVNGLRFIAKQWDANAGAERNLRATSNPIAW